jgi:hypothetical protein
MKLIERGEKYNQTIFCPGCGSKYIGSHLDDNVKERDYDYTMRPPTYRFWFTCQVCKETIDFNKPSNNDNGDK